MRWKQIKKYELHWITLIRLDRLYKIILNQMN